MKWWIFKVKVDFSLENHLFFYYKKIHIIISVINHYLHYKIAAAQEVFGAACAGRPHDKEYITDAKIYYCEWTCENVRRCVLLGVSIFFIHDRNSSSILKKDMSRKVASTLWVKPLKTHSHWLSLAI